MAGEWVDMVSAEMELSDRKYEEYLARKPHCEICGEAITDEWSYNLDMNGMYVHRGCLKDVASYLPSHIKWVWYEIAETLESTDVCVRTPEPDEWG